MQYDRTLDYAGTANRAAQMPTQQGLRVLLASRMGDVTMPSVERIEGRWVMALILATITALLSIGYLRPSPRHVDSTYRDCLDDIDDSDDENGICEELR